MLLGRAALASASDDSRAAEGFGREARELARRSADADLELCALSEIGGALVEMGRVEEGAPLLDEAMAGALGDHAADYRRAGLLPEGGVLVVGGGQSGCQIAEDLRAGGRQVVLATSPVGRAPTPYRGARYDRLARRSRVLRSAPA